MWLFSDVVAIFGPSWRECDLVRVACSFSGCCGAYAQGHGFASLVPLPCVAAALLRDVHGGAFRLVEWPCACGAPPLCRVVLSAASFAAGCLLCFLL